MKENLSHCLDLIGISEAGYSNHPEDPGGPTNHGVTQKTLSAWRKTQASVQDVQDLTKIEAREILSTQYATPIRFNDLPIGLDYCVLDCAVNSGPDRAARILQEVLGMSEVDGIIGLHTLSALEHSSLSGIIDDYCTDRLSYMSTLSNWGTFRRGWTTRVNNVRSTGTAMITGGPTTIIHLTPEGQAKAGGAVKVTATPSGKAAIANVGVTIAATVTAATQASSMLQPYADVSIIRYVLIGLALLTAAGTLVIAMQRAKKGATT